MDHEDLVALIRGGIPAGVPGAAGAGASWAELGAGEGNFTRALAAVLGPEAHIVAVDRDRTALKALDGRFETRVADFTKPLDLRDLDGVLMANSLHFVRDKEPVLKAVREMIKPGGRLIIVEYDADRGNPWVPHPFSYATWETMAARAGLKSTRLLSTYPSRWLGRMYSAVSEV